MSRRGLGWTSSYRGRLFLGYAIVVILLAAVWAFSLFGPLSSAVVGQQKRELRAVANAGSAMIASSTVTPTDVAGALSSGTDIRITVVDASGTVLADSREDPTRMENHASRPEVMAALRGTVGEAQRVSQTEGSEQLYVAVPATLVGARVAVRASETLANIGQVTARARRAGLLLLLAALVLAAIVAAVISRSLSRPIRDLSAAADRMARGDLSAEIPRPRGELGVLADSLGEVRRQIRGRIADLETEQRTMRSVLDGLHDAVFLIEGRTVQFANRAASRLVREPVGGWQGRVIDEIGLPVSLATRIVRGAQSSLPSAEDLPVEPTGRALRLALVPFAESGERRTLVIVSDVTERTRLERVRRDFVANASHELKTPAAGIQLLSESALHAERDGDHAAALGFVEQIERESTRLTRLVRDLLDLSRLDAASAPDSIADVRAAIANAMAGHQVAASARGLQLRSEETNAEGQDLFVKADPTDLAIALDNLLDNALTYTEQGSVTVLVEPTSGDVSLVVADTGIGIPEEDLPRVFERFYRVDRARTRESGGTGLGLALVRHVAERSGGRVSVQSTLGEGTRFTLTFKRAR